MDRVDLATEVGQSQIVLGEVSKLYEYGNFTLKLCFSVTGRLVNACVLSSLLLLVPVLPPGDCCNNL